jgi:protein-tyrosine phosphatase
MTNLTLLWLLLGIIGMVMLMIGITLWRVRRPIPYPTPESLIIPADTHFIAIEGVVNFRDIGGMHTPDGRQVRMGKIYRSASLSYITPQGKTAFLALQPCMICDLRSAEEVLNDPDPSFVGVRHEMINMATEGDKAKRLWLLLFNPQKLDGLLPQLYTSVILEENAPAIQRVIRLLLDEANYPMIIHCTAGKDRTGVVIALILALIGVPQATIIADYTQSNRFYHHYERIAHQLLRRLAFLRLNSANLFPILAADANTLRAVFAYLDDHYGGVMGYAQSRLGLGIADIERLRRLLLTEE